MRSGCARQAARGLAVGATALALTLSLAAAPSGAATSKALAKAKTQLLKRSDMPKGWTAQKNANSGGGKFPGEDQLASCIGVPSSTITLNPPSVNSPEFDNAAVTQTVTENIAVFPSSPVGRTEYAAIASPKTPACYGQILNGPIKSQLQSSFGAGASLSKIIVTKASVGGATGFTSSFTVKVQGRTIPLKLTSLFALKGVEGMQLQYTGIGNTFPTSLEQHLTSLAISRL